MQVSESSKQHSRKVVKEMTRKTINPDAPYQTINAASRLTGLSRDFIRRGVRAGRIPFIRAAGSGNAAYMINLPLFLKQLEQQSAASVGTEVAEGCGPHGEGR